jgi:hypothetical protein
MSALWTHLLSLNHQHHSRSTSGQAMETLLPGLPANLSASMFRWGL